MTVLKGGGRRRPGGPVVLPVRTDRGGESESGSELSRRDFCRRWMCGRRRSTAVDVDLLAAPITDIGRTMVMVDACVGSSRH